MIINIIGGKGNVDRQDTRIFNIVCYSQLIINQMEKCKWSFFKFNHYFQFTAINLI